MKKDPIQAAGTRSPRETDVFLDVTLFVRREGNTRRIWYADFRRIKTWRGKRIMSLGTPSLAAAKLVVQPLIEQHERSQVRRAAGVSLRGLPLGCLQLMLNRLVNEEGATYDLVYLIYCDELAAVKIGHSRNVKQRLADLRCASPSPLSLVGLFPGGLARETQIHRQFAHLRFNREWFKLDWDLLGWIEAEQSKQDDLWKDMGRNQ